MELIYLTWHLVSDYIFRTYQMGMNENTIIKDMKRNQLISQKHIWNELIFTARTDRQTRGINTFELYTHIYIFINAKTISTDKLLYLCIISWTT